MKFRISDELPEKMAAGQIIEYRISPAPGIWFTWLPEIRHVREGGYFVNEQCMRPCKRWQHKHHFVPVAGGVKRLDRVSYDIGWGPLGWPTEHGWVNRQLAEIFAYRQQKAEKIFGPHG